MGEPYHEGPETTLEVQKIVEGVYTTIPQFNERTPTAILFKTKLNSFFFFLAIILLVGCDKGTDIGPIVRLTYNGVGVSGPVMVEVYPPGKDVSIKISLEKDCEIESIIVDEEMSSSKDTVINLYDVTENHSIEVTGRKKAVAPTITVTIVKDSIPYGTSTSFSWVAEGEITSVILDGSTVSKVGSFTTPILYANREYVLVVVGPGGMITEKVSIYVGNYIPTRTDTLCSRPWFLGAIDKLVNNKWEIAAVLFPEEKTNHWQFYNDGIWKIFHIDGTLSGIGKWSWSTNAKEFTLGNNTGNYSLSDTIFIRYFYNSEGLYQQRVTFWRP